MNSFTYIIRSDNRNFSSSISAANCQIHLGGLPTKYKSFLVEPIGFYCDDLNLYYLEVYSDNFPFINGYDTRGKSLRVLFSTALLNNSSQMVYKVDNFNGRDINFKIFDDADTIFNIVVDWKLYLKFTGIEE